MNHNHLPEDRKRVYLACRDVFAGTNALLRKQKKIREMIIKRVSALQPLLNELGEKKVVDIAKALLEMQIFESESKASVLFSGMSVKGNVGGEARSVQNGLGDTCISLEKEDIDMDLVSEHEFPVDSDVVASTSDSPKTVPSLYPSYLPHRTQHLILSTTQRILEECCFDFAAKHLPSMVHGHGWECGAAMELTRWTRTLAKHAAELPPHATTVTGSALHEVLFSTDKLRNTAVHRVRSTARGVLELIKTGVKMCETLHDGLRAAQLDGLHDEIESNIKSMEVDKNTLEDGLVVALAEIKRQHEELDRKEKELIEGALREDHENKALIGTLLEESVPKILAAAEQAKLNTQEITGGQDMDQDVGNGNGIKAENRGGSPEYML